MRDQFSQKFTSSSPSSSQRRGVEAEGVKNNGWILDDFLATRTDRGVVVRFGRDWSGVTGVRPTDQEYAQSRSGTDEATVRAERRGSVARWEILIQDDDFMYKIEEFREREMNTF